ncbi:hypothetical protein TNCV_3312341 [Trichonephila clavipes]|nr:hypothetical protein TNCV_3312341 [Trichonephila clavipes]
MMRLITTTKTHAATTHVMTITSHTTTQSYLNTEVPVWIGRGSVKKWPSRSPYIPPLDFSVWAFVNDRVHYAIFCIHA